MKRILLTVFREFAAKEKLETPVVETSFHYGAGCQRTRRAAKSIGLVFAAEGGEGKPPIRRLESHFKRKFL